MTKVYLRRKSIKRRTTARKNLKRRTTARKNLKRRTTARKNLKRRTTSRKSIKRRTTARKSIKRRTTARKSIKGGSNETYSSQQLATILFKKLGLETPAHFESQLEDLSIDKLISYPVIERDGTRKGNIKIQRTGVNEFIITEGKDLLGGVIRQSSTMSGMSD